MCICARFSIPLQLTFAQQFHIMKDKVKVLEVDVPRQRISLTMRMGDQPGAAGNTRGQAPAGERRGGRPARGEQKQSGPAAPSGATFANLFANARHLRK